jgi:hypothetical protein
MPAEDDIVGNVEVLGPRVLSGHTDTDIFPCGSSGQ